ncbi:MAG: hypothetical protein ABI091_07795 [Ferruginibacter sp.]
MKITMPFVILIFLFSCTMKKKEEAIDMSGEKAKLIQADKAFSDLSEKEGMKNAFLEYIDSNGVLLKPDHMPIIGANAIDYLIQVSDTAFTLNWQPQHAFVSKSADLGYTYGIYALHSNTKDTVLYGTYVSIWKKQADGKWKFVLDSGNEGIGDEAQ